MTSRAGAGLHAAPVLFSSRQQVSMAHREFVDADGVEWQVWEVVPSTAERRASGERRFGARVARERRTQQQLRVRMEDGLAAGWLVFECGTEKRRLHPVPQGWSELSDDGLAALGRSADVAARTSPRLIE